MPSNLYSKWFTDRSTRHWNVLQNFTCDLCSWFRKPRFTFGDHMLFFMVNHADNAQTC